MLSDLLVVGQVTQLFEVDLLRVHDEFEVDLLRVLDETTDRQLVVGEGARLELLVLL